MCTIGRSVYDLNMKIFVLALAHAALVAAAFLMVSFTAGVLFGEGSLIVSSILGVLIAYAVTPVSLLVFRDRVAPLEIAEFAYTSGGGMFVLLAIVGFGGSVVAYIICAVIAYVFFFMTGRGLRRRSV